MDKRSNRSRLISWIHAQKNSAGLDEENYRLIVSGATGKHSCSECSMKELKEIFSDLNSVLSKQGKECYSFYPRWENPSMCDAVTARAKKLLGKDWKKRLDLFAKSRFKKDSYTKCDNNELKSVMAFLSKIDRKERVAK